MKPFYISNDITLFKGDVLSVLKDLPEESVVYSLSMFMSEQNYCNRFINPNLSFIL